jgi:ketosteroid isomerase-like protein
MTPTTEAVILNHLQAATIGVDAVLEDYMSDSVLITAQATYRGPAEIRTFFTDFLGGCPEGFFEKFTMLRMESAGDLGYINWKSLPTVPAATDTFVVRDGKILYQTFTGLTAPA